MNKKLLTATACCLCLTTAHAQVDAQQPVKWDPAIGHLLKTAAAHTQGLEGKTADVSNELLVINCKDAETVASRLQKAGYVSTVISDRIITAEVPVGYIPVIAEMEEVNYINASVTRKPFMSTSRKVTKANDILAGTGLETPFTGKGVIIGVIDQSFQYKHRAFLDDNGDTRVRAIWNRRSSYSTPTTTITNTADGYPGGHATHVTNIACGSKIAGNDFYGMAPEAEIIMIPSKFSDGEVLEDTKYIAEFAAAEGKPYVINMSFGSQVGPHDGTTDYCLGMDNYAKEGGILVAAVGNDAASKLHASDTFEEDGESLNLYVKDGTSIDYVEVWGQQTDGQAHLTVRPFVYNTTTKTRDFKDDAFWSTCGYVTSGISPNNNKQFVKCNISLATMRGTDTKLVFGLEITGNQGDSFHAWTSEDCGEFYKPIGAPTAATIDNLYCIGEGAATIPKAIAVGSFNGATSHTSAIDNASYSWSAGVGTKNSVSSFSNRGPFLGSTLKPLIVAPGAVVNSALNAKASDFVDNDIIISSIVTEGSTKHYYGVMSGTSMATPAVTGIVALWLQANPKLSPDDITDILKQTAVRDSYMGSDEWNSTRGYGKINAYEGLKLALQKAETGINDIHNSEAPVTLSKNNDSWRVLFNNSESFAQITLYSSSGQQLQSQTVNLPQKGDEVSVDLNGMRPGVYLIHIKTTKGSLTRKVMKH